MLFGKLGMCMMAFAWFNRFTNNQNTAYVIVRMILSTTLIYESPEGFEIQDSKFEIRNSISKTTNQEKLLK